MSNTPPPLPSGKPQVNLTLQEKDTPEAKESNQPSFLNDMAKDLKNALVGSLTNLASSGKGWVQGKSQQELAKAREITAQAIERIGDLVLQEQRQRHQQNLEIANQEMEHDARQREQEKHEMEMKERNTQLYFAAMKEAIDVTKELIEMGVDVDISLIMSQAEMAGQHQSGRLDGPRGG